MAAAASTGSVIAAAPLAATLASCAFVYLATSRLRGVSWGLAAAAIFATTPLVWRQYAHAPATLYPLPFVAAWLAAIALFDATRARAALLAPRAALGAGVSTAASAAVMMAVYLLLPVAAVPALRRTPFAPLAIVAGAFAAASAPMAVSMILRPDRLRDIVNAAHLYDANRFNVLQG